MRLLFLGNSHTYFNDMPYLCAELLRATGEEVEIAMLTRGGESLAGHLRNEQTRFNLLYGGWDLVLVQEVTSAFPPLEDYLRDLGAIHALCVAGGSRCALYMNFASPCDTPPLSAMRPSVLAGAKRFSLPVARAGDAFARAAVDCPEIDLYGPDRHHASPAGSYLIALSILRGVFGKDVTGLPGKICFRGTAVLDLPAGQAAALQAVAQSLPTGLCDAD